MPPAESEARRRFIADEATLAEFDLSPVDLADADLRGELIRREHPDLDRALGEGHATAEVNGHPVNARMHLLMHEVVAAQLWEDEPPEVWQTTKRLLAAGYEREQILHMLAASALDGLWGAVREELDFDRDAHLAALAALPGSWEPQGRGDEGGP